MAGKTKRMNQIKQLLRLHKLRTPIKRMARELGISRNTVKGYFAKLDEGGHDMDTLLALEDPALEAVFHSDNPAYNDPRYLHMSGKLAYFERELVRTGVTKQLPPDKYWDKVTIEIERTILIVAGEPNLTASNNAIA